MGWLLLKELCLATVYLLDVLGLADLYQLYCDLLAKIRRVWVARTHFHNGR